MRFQENTTAKEIKCVAAIAVTRNINTIDFMVLMKKTVMDRKNYK